MSDLELTVNLFERITIKIIIHYTTHGCLLFRFPLTHSVRGTCLCLEQTTLDITKFGIKEPGQHRPTSPKNMF